MREISQENLGDLTADLGVPLDAMRPGSPMYLAYVAGRRDGARDLVAEIDAAVLKAVEASQATWRQHQDVTEAHRASNAAYLRLRAAIMQAAGNAAVRNNGLRSADTDL